MTMNSRKVIDERHHDVVLKQLALAERRLKIAEKALREYRERRNWCRITSSIEPHANIWRPVCDGWEPAEKALKDMENVK